MENHIVCSIFDGFFFFIREKYVPCILSLNQVKQQRDIWSEKREQKKKRKRCGLFDSRELHYMLNVIRLNAIHLFYLCHMWVGRREETSTLYYWRDTGIPVSASLGSYSSEYFSLESAASTKNSLAECSPATRDFTVVDSTGCYIGAPASNLYV
jgi:hypothetical protein